MSAILLRDCIEFCDDRGLGDPVEIVFPPDDPPFIRMASIAKEVPPHAVVCIAAFLKLHEMIDENGTLMLVQAVKEYVQMLERIGEEREETVQ